MQLAAWRGALAAQLALVHRAAPCCCHLVIRQHRWGRTCRSGKLSRAQLALAHEGGWGVEPDCPGAARYLRAVLQERSALGARVEEAVAALDSGGAPRSAPLSQAATL